MGTGFETSTAELKLDPATVSVPEKKEAEEKIAFTFSQKRRLTNQGESNRNIARKVEPGDYNPMGKESDGDSSESEN